MEVALTARMRRYFHEIFSGRFVRKAAVKLGNGMDDGRWTMDPMDLMDLMDPMDNGRWTTWTASSY